ncbi:hypothetical protein Q4528_16465, partial [Staphylococcus pasteuri_A]|nr:hypothetical protein [Staphylococcus pasteuri_A]
FKRRITRIWKKLFKRKCIGTLKKLLRWTLVLVFGSAGVLHFTHEINFRTIVPDYLPLQKTAVLFTCVFEIFFVVDL